MKKAISIMLSVIMAFSVLSAMPFSAAAGVKWTAIASSDFSSVSSVSNSTNFTPSTYKGKGNTITWQLYDWTGNPSVSEDAISLPDGYMRISGYSGGSVPISGSKQWKIDFGFRFKTGESGEDEYYNSDEYSFLKMYVYTDNFANPAEKNAAYCYLAQNANGLCYSWEDDGHNAGARSQATSITANNSHLEVGVNYHYIAEFTGNYFTAYITDESGKVVQVIVQTDESTFISRLNNINSENITAFKIGDDDNAYFFKGLEYRNITFYSGEEPPAPTKWTAVASSDFSDAGMTFNTPKEVPVLYEGTEAMTWNIWGNESGFLQEEDAVTIDDGYMYLVQDKNPLSGSSRFKIDLGFRFKTNASDDFWQYSGKYCLMKLFVYTGDTRDPGYATHNYCLFSQDVNGNVYSWDEESSITNNNAQNKSICTGSPNLTVGVNYHYIAEYRGNYFRAYITNDNGTVVQEIINTNNSAFLEKLSNVTDTGDKKITAFKIGSDDWYEWFKDIEYRNITLYTGEEGEEGEEEELADTPAGRLKEAISRYELKMNGTVYLDMAEAYDAYVEANKAYDAYKYGDMDIDLDEYASDLRTKTDAMERWNYSPDTVTPYFDGDTWDNSTYADHGVANILYWGSPYESDGAKWTTYNAKTVIELWYPQNTVLLMDGKSTPAMPILGMAKRDSDDTRYVYQMYPCVSDSDSSQDTNWKMGTTASDTLWYGVNGKHHRNHDWTWAVNDRGENSAVFKGEPGAISPETRLYLSRDDGAWGLGATNYWAVFANTLRFNAAQSEYVKTYTVHWYAVTGNDASDPCIISPTYQIHVVNIKPLLELIESSKNEAYLSVAENTYTQGGLRTLLEAYDKATAVNPSGYYYQELSNLNKAASDIASACEAMNSAAVTSDKDGYAALRKALALKKSIFSAGSEGYKEESWNEFVSIYEEGVKIFANIQQTGYNNPDYDRANSEYAYEVAQYLNAVQLETVYDKVDSAELEMLIEEAESAVANEEYFTADSFALSDIQMLAMNAKNAIWGSEENYPNAKFKLDLYEENTALVNAHCLNLKNAIYTLEIDRNAAVLTADNNSMLSATRLSENYSSKDYGNHVILAAAVDSANSFVTTVNNANKNCIESKISEYKEKVRAIINAINLLRPAFDKITNGTFGSFTENDSTMIKSVGDKGDSRWTLNFVRNNNVVIFRTQYQAFNVDLGGAKFIWHSGDKSHDGHLDTVNIYDTDDVKVGEIKSGTKYYKIFGELDDVSITDQADNFPGRLSYSKNGATYTLKNLTVSYSSAERLGKDLYGVDINDTSYIFDQILLSTQGEAHDMIAGVVSAHHGDTVINSDFVIRIPSEQRKDLSASTVPKLTTYNLESNIGMVYYWKYTADTILWHGYSHDRTAYSQKTYVMNIAPLIRLIDACMEYENEEKTYQKNAWNAFSEALSDARADMEYGSMNPEDIETACRTRYTNLWNAYRTLLASPAANNESIHAIVEANKEIGAVFKADNTDGRWSDTRWNAFKQAYISAADAIAQGGEFSDENVRNYTTEKQGEIDAVASALETAYNELITYGCRADFSPVINAAHTYLDDGLYTAASLEALSEELKNSEKYPLLNMSDEDRASYYAEQEVVDSIMEEAQLITSAFALLPVQKDTDVDDSALEAAKAYAKAQIKDPDAYANVDEIKALINNADNEREVLIFGNYSVKGVKFATTEEINSAVSSILSGLSVKNYEVKVVDENGNPLCAKFYYSGGEEIQTADGIVCVPYSARISICAPDNEEADWYYSYNSNTVSQTASKYYTTSVWLNLTVKGNTTLTVKSAASETETVKITYVNIMTGKTFAVDYAPKGTEYALKAAPALAYYDFDGFTLEEDSEDYITGFEPEEDTIVYANYTVREAGEGYTVYIGNMGGSVTTLAEISNIAYNDLIELCVGTGANGLYSKKSTGKGRYEQNGESLTLSKRYTSTEIYAWVAVYEDDWDIWEEFRNDTSEVFESIIENTENILMFGDSYSFRVCENVYIIPYTEEQFNNAVQKGYIKTGDENKASVRVQENIINETNGEKISMIGSYTLPKGNYELVEAGMLFKATTNGSIPEGDFTLANAGTNGIARMKSSNHTLGNQFVISVNTSMLHGVTVVAKYVAYMIYTDGENQHIVYSQVATNSTYLS